MFNVVPASEMMSPILGFMGAHPLITAGVSFVAGAAFMLVFILSLEGEEETPPEIDGKDLEAMIRAGI